MVCGDKFALLRDLLMLVVTSVVLLLAPRIRATASRLTFGLFLSSFLARLRATRDCTIVAKGNIGVSILQPVNTARCTIFGSNAKSSHCVGQGLLLPRKSGIVRNCAKFVGKNDKCLRPGAVVVRATQCHCAVAVRLKDNHCRIGGTGQ